MKKSYALLLLLTLTLLLSGCGNTATELSTDSEVAAVVEETTEMPPEIIYIDGYHDDELLAQPVVVEDVWEQVKSYAESYNTLCVTVYESDTEQDGVTDYGSVYMSCCDTTEFAETFNIDLSNITNCYEAEMSVISATGCDLTTDKLVLDENDDRPFNRLMFTVTDGSKLADELAANFDGDVTDYVTQVNVQWNGEQYWLGYYMIDITYGENSHHYITYAFDNYNVDMDSSAMESGSGCCNNMSEMVMEESTEE
jgi:hypothetical protein